MSDKCKTETQSNLEIRKEWVRPELQQIGIEQITAHHANRSHADGVTGEYSY